MKPCLRASSSKVARTPDHRSNSGSFTTCFARFKTSTLMSMGEPVSGAVRERSSERSSVPFSSSSIYFKIVCRVFSFTPGFPFTARETVALETPRRLATSAMDTFNIFTFIL